MNPEHRSSETRSLVILLPAVASSRVFNAESMASDVESLTPGWEDLIADHELPVSHYSAGAGE